MASGSKTNDAAATRGSHSPKPSAAIGREDKFLSDMFEKVVAETGMSVEELEHGKKSTSGPGSKAAPKSPSSPPKSAMANGQDFFAELQRQANALAAKEKSGG